MLTLKEFKLIFQEKLIGLTEKQIKDKFIKYLQTLDVTLS